MDEAAFLELLPLIENIVAFIVRRKHCGRDEAEEFASIAKLKLIEDNYAVFDRFAGRSSLRTYLTAVLYRLFLDQRIAKWGRWRPSTSARRLGELGVRLEVLLSRDGRSFDEACELLITNERRGVTRERLRDLAAELPPRATRRLLDETALEDLGVSASVVEAPTIAREVESRAREIRALFAGALSELSGEDRLVLRMRFHDDFTVPEIARALHLEEKALYRRIDRILGLLRIKLTARGIEPHDVRAMLDEDVPAADGVGGLLAGMEGSSPLLTA